MGKARAQDVANAAVELLMGYPLIPYVPGKASRLGADCQGFVKLCVAEAGGEARYSGSNAMYRACVKASAVWPYKDSARLKPGALLFIVAGNGKEPDQYKPDGLGNASHVGVYVGKSDEMFSVDSSASAGHVRTRSKRDAPYVWTHIGYLPEIDYDEPRNTSPIVEDEIVGITHEPSISVAPVQTSPTTTPPTQSIPSEFPYNVRVTASSVNIRALPSKISERVGSAAGGQTLTIYETRITGGSVWGKTDMIGSDGSTLKRWVDLQFTQRLSKLE